MVHANTLREYLKISRGATRLHACKNEVIIERYRILVAELLASMEWLLLDSPNRMDDFTSNGLYTDASGSHGWGAYWSG